LQELRLGDHVHVGLFQAPPGAVLIHQVAEDMLDSDLTYVEDVVEQILSADQLK